MHVAEAVREVATCPTLFVMGEGHCCVLVQQHIYIYIRVPISITLTPTRSIVATAVYERDEDDSPIHWWNGSGIVSLIVKLVYCTQ